MRNRGMSRLESLEMRVGNLELRLDGAVKSLMAAIEKSEANIMSYVSMSETRFDLGGGYE